MFIFIARKRGRAFYLEKYTPFIFKKEMIMEKTMMKAQKREK